MNHDVGTGFPGSSERILADLVGSFPFPGLEFRIICDILPSLDCSFEQLVVLCPRNVWVIKGVNQIEPESGLGTLNNCREPVC